MKVIATSQSALARRRSLVPGTPAKIGLLLAGLLPLSFTAACNQSADSGRKGPARSGQASGNAAADAEADDGDGDGEQKNARANKSGKGKGGRAKASDNTKTKSGSEGPAAAGPAGASDGAGALDADGCCKYCMDDTMPCGDRCIASTASCGDAEGCACEASKRPERAFKKGDLAATGMIREDVAAYNRAQGDPIDGEFTLAMAFEGAPELADTSAGKLYATFDTSMGSFSCELFENEAPLTVANFVGLSRGVRPSYDSKTKEWRKVTYFDNIVFHRVIERFMVQGGDPAGTGMGTPGYFIPDEFSAKRRHDGPGVLSMANRNPVDQRTQKLNVDKMTGRLLGNTGSAQFFITVVATKQLDDRHTVFGKCDPAVPIEISKVPVTTNAALRYDHRPKEDVVLKSIKFERKP